MKFTSMFFTGSAGYIRFFIKNTNNLDYNRPVKVENMLMRAVYMVCRTYFYKKLGVFKKKAWIPCIYNFISYFCINEIAYFV